MDGTISRLLKQLGTLMAAALAWAVFLMVYFERTLPPFGFLEDWFMPWRHLFDAPPDSTLAERMEYMHSLLDRSVLVGNLGLALMAASAITFGIYATFVYQQKQRRARDNELLKMKNREIARRNEFIRYISATISHEFKNNLGRIKRRIDLLGLPGEPRTRIMENMDRLFADIEVFKKIADEREAGLVRFERMELMDLLRATSAHYADLARFTFQGPLSDATIFAARDLLRTVFENLFDNAVKHKKPEQPVAEITVTMSMDQDGPRKYVTISVRDEGMGMDEQRAEQCFYGLGGGGGPQGGGDTQDRDTRASGGSWGQGLYFAKYVIGLHAGKIRVGKEHTAPDKGTEIIINLPYVEEALDV